MLCKDKWDVLLLTNMRSIPKIITVANMAIPYDLLKLNTIIDIWGLSLKVTEWQRAIFSLDVLQIYKGTFLSSIRPDNSE